MNKKPIDEAHWFSNRQVIAIISVVVVGTFYVTINYAAFEQLRVRHQNDVEALKIEFQNKLDEFEARAIREFDIIDAQEAKDEQIEEQRFSTIERRLDKKIERLDQVEKEVQQLKQKGSDKE